MSELPAGPRELELSAPEMRRLVMLALERLVAHVESLPRQPSADVAGAAELARSLRESLPEEGAPYEDLLALLFESAVPKSFNTAGPGYLAYIPGGGLFHAGVADLIADVTNRFVGVWMAAPALVQIEANVGRWLESVSTPDSCQLFKTYFENASVRLVKLCCATQLNTSRWR